MKLSSMLAMPINAANKHVMLPDGKVVLIPASDESVLTRLTAFNMLEAAKIQAQQLHQVLADWAFLTNEDFEEALANLDRVNLLDAYNGKEHS